MALVEHMFLGQYFHGSKLYLCEASNVETLQRFNVKVKQQQHEDEFASRSPEASASRFCGV